MILIENFLYYSECLIYKNIKVSSLTPAAIYIKLAKYLWKREAYLHKE